MRELNVYKCSKLVKVYNNNETFYTDYKGVNKNCDNDENRRLIVSQFTMLLMRTV